MNSAEIKTLRLKLGYSQQEFAKALGVSFATINRWENDKAKPQKDRLKRLQELWHAQENPEAQVSRQISLFPRLNFEGDGEAIKLVVDAYKLQNGHLFNKAFGLELSRVVPLPHQRIAVYENLLPQNPLRFLLADDAGAGKTIMTGLYIREMINRGRLNRVLIVCPAGLTWNWQRELLYFFDLNFKILKGVDFQKGNPFSDPDSNHFIISVDTGASDLMREFFLYEKDLSFDLTVFDEAHKLAWNNPKRKDSKTRRYRLAEILSLKTNHLLLLTATPHMGKPFPYFALWRLLDQNILSTQDSLDSMSVEKKSKYFLRRLKEEMVDYKSKPIYMPRLCQTISFKLSPEEQLFYKESSEYLKWSYESNRGKNKNAAAMVVAVLQRRLASSTYAMLESLKRRKAKVLKEETAPFHQGRLSLEGIMEYFDFGTADDNEILDNGFETDESIEDQALSSVQPDSPEIQKKELERLERVIALGEEVNSTLNESKFVKLRELIESAEFQNEKLLIFTEHRDTLNYLRRRFEALGYTGQIASIHGGMNVKEREEQRILFMTPDFRRALGIKNPDGLSARIMLATDAAGEGINLQFAWVMVNYDIPWNPARLEQRMGRLHRFGQKHPEVRIFNLVAKDTREGDVLSTLLDKLEEARKDLCSDKVFDVIGQQLQEVSIRDLIRDALFENPPYSGQKKIESYFATQKLRSTIEKQRESATKYGDVAKRLGQLKSQLEIEGFSKLLPAFVQNFIEKSTKHVGLRIEGDLSETARFLITGEEGRWLTKLADDIPGGLPDYFSVHGKIALQEQEGATIAFLRPGDMIFDSLCREVVNKFQRDIQRGAVFCDPKVEEAYYTAVYICQIGEGRSPSKGEPGNGSTNLMDKRLLGLRWNDKNEFQICPPNHLLALHSAPPSSLWKAGTLLRNPEDHVEKADAYARMFAETTFLQQARTSFQAETISRMDDLTRGFDFLFSELAERRSELARSARNGDEKAAKELEEVKKDQSQLEEEKARNLVFEQRRPEQIEIVKIERIAVALVVPDSSPEAQETFLKNVEEMAMRIARNFEVDRYSARVYDVSSPHLARGYDLESHRGNGEKVVIEVKGLSGRGSVHLTENEWPTAVNVRDKYWLYVVADCATNPTLYRVQDPAFKLTVKSRQSFTANIGDIIREAEND